MITIKKRDCYFISTMKTASCHTHWILLKQSLPQMKNIISGFFLHFGSSVADSYRKFTLLLNNSSGLYFTSKATDFIQFTD